MVIYLVLTVLLQAFLLPVQGATAGLSSACVFKHRGCTTHAFIATVPEHHHFPLPDTQHAHHIDDMEMADDVPPQLQHKTDLSCPVYITGITTPPAQEPCNFPYPVYDITAPPPEA